MEFSVDAPRLTISNDVKISHEHVSHDMLVCIAEGGKLCRLGLLAALTEGLLVWGADVLVIRSVHS